MICTLKLHQTKVTFAGFILEFLSPRVLTLETVSLLSDDRGFSFEGLKLQTSAFESFAVVNLPYPPFG